MSAMHTIPELDRKGLREFGITTGVIVVVIFGLFFPWLLNDDFFATFGQRLTTFPSNWSFVLCAVLVVWGLVAPMSLNPVYKTWMKFGLFMGSIMTPLIMGIIFYGMFTPVAFLLKILGKDAMVRRFEDSDSYRITSKKAPAKNLEKPY